EVLLHFLAGQREADDIQHDWQTGILQLLRRPDRIAAARLLPVGDHDERAAADRLEIARRLQYRIHQRRLAARPQPIDDREDSPAIEPRDLAHETCIRTRLLL